MYSGFLRDLLAIMRCPRDRGPLHLPSSSEADRILHADLTCSSCGVRFEICDGVLKLLPGQRPIGETMRDEQRARDRGAEAHSGLRPFGTLFGTAYYYSLLRRLLRRPLEGLHAGGIFYHRFTVPGLRAELDGLFEIADIFPLQPDRRGVSLLTRVIAWRNSPRSEQLLARCAGQLLFLRAIRRGVDGSVRIGSVGQEKVPPADAPDQEQVALPSHVERDR